MRRWNAVAVTCVALFAAACGDQQDPTASAAAPSFGAVREITYAIQLAGTSYDAVANTTTFTWSVSSNPAGGPAISHWVVQFPADVTPVIVGSNDPTAGFSNPDPTTQIRGIKFDTGYGDNETRVVTLTLEGAWQAGPVGIAVKSGNGFVLGTVGGPVPAAVVVPTYTLSGVAFFDMDGDGARDTDEPALGGVTVTLSNGATATTAADGSYAFPGLAAGSYTVAATTPAGLFATTATSLTVQLAANTTVSFGSDLSYATLCGQTAGGFTIGYWKNNLDKALAGKTNGVQVSAATLAGLVSTVSGFALEPFAGITMSGAAAVMSANGSDPVLLLKKQLMGAEMNYANGAFIGGSELVTRLFLYEGEYMVKNASAYPASALLTQKNWYDAYNNTHGGAIAGIVCGS